MGVESFRQFLQQSERAKADGKPIDWDATREEFLAALDELYGEVKGYLDEFSGQVKIQEVGVEISEEKLGRYNAKGLTIIIAGETVRLTPIGADVVAAKGRVDMVGPRGTVRFVRVNEHARTPGFGLSMTMGGEVIEEKAPLGLPPGKFVWRISTPPPRIRYLPITADEFLDRLQAVMNGA